MKPHQYFEDKIVAVTGAGSGIGKALCEVIVGFSPRKLILADIHESALDDLRRTLDFRNAQVLPVDVSSEPSMTAFFRKIVTENGRLDMIFNNAGIAAGGEFQKYTTEQWHRLLDVNLWGVIHGSTLAYRQMLIQGHGHIINTASLGGLIPEPMAAAYAATKHAVVGLTTTLREEAHDHGIRVSVACPGVIRTPIFDKAIYVGDVDPAKLIPATLAHGAISAEACAKKIVSGVTGNKGIIIVKPTDYLFWLLYRMSPSILSPVNRLIARYFRKHFRISEAY